MNGPAIVQKITIEIPIYNEPGGHAVVPPEGSTTPTHTKPMNGATRTGEVVVVVVVIPVLPKTEKCTGKKFFFLYIFEKQKILHNGNEEK